MKDVSPERWRLIEEIFDAAVELPPEDRSAFLHLRCARDPELRAAVEALLAEADLDTPLPASAIGFAAPLLPRPDAASAEPASAPARIGAYRVIRELGHGGMGTVFLAERDDDQFRKRVAIKLLRRGFISEELTRRFRHERQILANLDHPHIARLLDGGVLDGGPYLVMEYVDGIPLDAFCEQHQLGLAERLRLFADVCAAVQYAHQNLVVHRDLKPGNILVTAERQVKLLDFGIAKLLDESAPDTPLTRTGVHVMTPEYAAPEQVRAGAVTTATDVYALGVILYELLVGERPYALGGRSLSEIERAICETEPVRPSTALRRREPAVRQTTGADADETSGRARRRRERFRRKLQGDLDTIVIKALQKDPSRRYPSAAAMLDDLHRFQQGRPVLARPDTAGYRARKFLLRHRAGVVAAVVLLLLGQGFGLREAQLRRRAETAAERAAAVRDYLASVFDVSNPFGTGTERGEDVTARTLLDRGAERAELELAGQPDAQAEMLGVLGRVYVNLGLLDRAEPLLQRSLEQRRSLYGERHAAVAEALDAVAELYVQQGRFDLAETVARQALTMRRGLFGSRHALTAQSLDRLATVLQEKSAYADAAPLFREALAIRERLFGADHADVAASLNNVALLHFWMGEDAEAERLYRRSADIRRRVHGDEHANTLSTIQNLAQVLHVRGEWVEAEVLFRESLELKRRVFGNAHPAVTVHLNNLAALLRDMGRLEEAEAHAREALALDLQIFSDDHPYVNASRQRVASILMDRGELAEAAVLWQIVLESALRTYGAEHIRVLQAYDGLGVVQQRGGDLAGAEASFRTAHTLARSLFSDDHLWAVATGASLGRTLHASGRGAEAEPLLRDVVERTSAATGALRNPAISARVGLGLVLMETNPAEAEPLLHGALDLSRDVNGEDHWRTADVKLALGALLTRQRRFAEAESLLMQADAALRASPVRNPWLVEQARASMARLAAARRHPDTVTGLARDG